MCIRDRVWLQEQLAFSHKTDFDERVRQVMEFVGPRFEEAVGSPVEWRKWVKQARNSVAHRAPGMVNIEDEWRTAVRVTESIRWLLVLVMLNELDLREDLVQKCQIRLQGPSARLQQVKPEWFDQTVE